MPETTLGFATSGFLAGSFQSYFSQTCFGSGFGGSACSSPTTSDSFSLTTSRDGSGAVISAIGSTVDDL